MMARLEHGEDYFMIRHPQCSFAVLLLATLATLSGCDRPVAVAKDDMVLVGVRGLNYTDIPVGIFYVEDKWASNVGSYNAATSSATSYQVPRNWRPGLTVRIDWQNDLLYHRDEHALHRSIVEIPPYDGRISDLYVVFLPCDRIKVFVSLGGPGHESFPDARFVNPRQYCAADARCREKFIDNPQIVYKEEMDARRAALRAYHEDACTAVEEGISPL